jgi:hypothetical protein
MKRIIITIASLVLFSAASQAQNKTKKGTAKTAASKTATEKANLVKDVAKPIEAPVAPAMPQRPTAPTPTAGTSAPAAPTPVAPAAPAAPVYDFNTYLTVDKLENDFGAIPEGPKAVTQFTVKNISNEPITIERVQASCGCTVPTWDKSPIAPGQTGVFTAEFTTQGRGGQDFNKSLTIFTTRGQKAVTIKGKVIKSETPVDPTAAPAPANGGH